MEAVAARSKLRLSFTFFLLSARARARAPAWISNSYNSGRGRGRACCRVADLGFGVHMKIFETDGQESIFNWCILFQEEEISVCAKIQLHPLRSVRDLEDSHFSKIVDFFQYTDHCGS